MTGVCATDWRCVTRRLVSNMSIQMEAAGKVANDALRVAGLTGDLVAIDDEGQCRCLHPTHGACLTID